MYHMSDVSDSPPACRRDAPRRFGNGTVTDFGLVWIRFNSFRFVSLRDDRTARFVVCVVVRVHSCVSVRASEYEGGRTTT